MTNTLQENLRLAEEKLIQEFQQEISDELEYYRVRVWQDGTAHFPGNHIDLILTQFLPLNSLNEIAHRFYKVVNNIFSIPFTDVVVQHAHVPDLDFGGHTICLSVSIEGTST